MIALFGFAGVAAAVFCPEHGWTSWPHRCASGAAAVATVDLTLEREPAEHRCDRCGSYRSTDTLGVTNGACWTCHAARHAPAADAAPSEVPF